MKERRFTAPRLPASLLGGDKKRRGQASRGAHRSSFKIRLSLEAAENAEKRELFTGKTELRVRDSIKIIS